MAKISAYGEHEIARWTRRVRSGVAGRPDTKQTLVLTEKKNGKPGRLLRKSDSEATYTVLMKSADRKDAESYAHVWGFEQVSSR